MTESFLRFVPAVEGDLATRRHWVIIREPGGLPQKKGPFLFGQVDAFLEELEECRSSETEFTVVSLAWDFDISAECGRDRLAINRRLSEAAK